MEIFVNETKKFSVDEWTLGMLILFRPSVRTWEDESGAFVLSLSAPTTGPKKQTAACSDNILD